VDATGGPTVVGLIPNKCAENVVAVFDGLHGELGPELFGKLFPVILTERGTEFSNPTRIETALDGTRRTNVCFCNPMNANPKSQIERNHELVREILPKGVSFDALEQEQIDLALSHVNAYIRQSQSDIPDVAPRRIYPAANGACAMGWVSDALIGLESTSSTRFRLLKTEETASPASLGRISRQSQCTSVSRGAFTLPMVAFTLSGNPIFLVA
jgi:hypothetical protein